MPVIVATDEDFKQHLADNPKVVVKYFASWCGSCRLIAPKFKRISNAEDYSDVVFLDVDAEKNPEARAMAGKIPNLPFFATFKDGALVEGDFTAKIDFVEKMIDNL